MGRDIKRVPLDFDWPLGTTWKGYLMPASLESAPCPAALDCFHGQTAARAWVERLAELALMLDDKLAQQHRAKMHPYFDSIPRPSGRGRLELGDIQPSADIAEFCTGLAGRPASFLGHDAIDRWKATDTLITAAGLDPKVWGVCPSCQGRGSVDAYPGQQADAEAWEPAGPPPGDGWQLWETVSEGSPISPVFASAGGLAQWLTTPAACWGAMRSPMTIEAARRFVQAGCAPSLVVDATGVHDGAAFVGAERAAKDNTP